jgi:cell division protein FtsN
MFKDLKRSVLGVLILVVGIIIGVILVGQTQSFKNKAKEQTQQKYTICHKTGNPSNPEIEISVDAEQLPEYLDAGDIFGKCP